MLRSVHDDAIQRHVQTLVTARSRLQLSHQLWKKSRNVDKTVTALDIGCKNALRFAKTFNEVATSVSAPTISLLINTWEMSVVVKPFIERYTLEASEAVAKVNGLADKVSDIFKQDSI